jgi:hypothetical protein
MQTKREKELIKKISSQYGQVIDLKKTPGVLVEILREYGPSIGRLLDHEGRAGDPPTPPSSIAIAGPGSGSVLLEDLMRIILDLRQEVAKLSAKVTSGR